MEEGDTEYTGRLDGKNSSLAAAGQSSLSSPPLYSVHKGKIRRVAHFGAFVSIPGYDRDGLLHISRLSAERVERVESVVAVGDQVWCKVVEVDRDQSGKYQLDIRFVSQRDGHDQDPNNVHAGEKSKGVHSSREQTGRFPKIELGAILKTTCTRCGGGGHLPFECFARMSGNEVKHYDLLKDEEDDDADPGISNGDETSQQAAPRFATGGNMEPLTAPRSFPKESATQRNSDTKEGLDMAEKRKKNHRKTERPKEKEGKRHRKAESEDKNREKETSHDKSKKHLSSDWNSSFESKSSRHKHRGRKKRDCSSSDSDNSSVRRKHQSRRKRHHSSTESDSSSIGRHSDRHHKHKKGWPGKKHRKAKRED